MVLDIYQLMMILCKGNQLSCTGLQTCDNWDKNVRLAQSVTVFNQINHMIEFTTKVKISTFTITKPKFYAKTSKSAVLN